VVSFF